MVFPPLRRVILAVAFLVPLTLVVAGTALAQEGVPPPSETPTSTPGMACVANAQMACVKLLFYPATLVGDLFLVDPVAGDMATPQVQQSALYVTFANPAAGQTAVVKVKNIHGGGAEEGTLYMYPDITKTVSAPYAAGVTTTTMLYPVKKYIRGKIAAKCAPLSVAAGEDVGCLVSIDGTPQAIPTLTPTPPPTPLPDGTIPTPTSNMVLAAGQTAMFVVEPGSHEVKFDLTGADADRWAPTSQIKTVDVQAAAYPAYATATFTKAGHLVATLALAHVGWVGDFYVDGIQVATQVGSAEAWVKANSQHTVEVRRISLSQWPLIHRYQDGSATFYAYSAVTNSVTVTQTDIPADQMAFPYLDNPDHVVSASKYVFLKPGERATTQAIAEEGMRIETLYAFLNDQNMGDLAPFLTPVTKISDDSYAYAYFWLLPLGKLSPGTYTVEYIFVMNVDWFDGLKTWARGFYVLKQPPFTVVPEAPQASPTP